MTQTLIFPHEILGFIRVTGRDARDYLNRRLCQKVLDIADGHGRRAFLLDAIGKMQLDVEVYAHGGEVLLLAPSAGREEIVSQLERYVFTEDCAFTDCSVNYSAFAIVGERRAELLGTLNLPAPTTHQVVVKDGVLAFGSDYALGGVLLLVPTHEADSWSHRLKEAVSLLEGAVIGDTAFESLRIAAGFPAWRVDITLEDMPLDVPSLRHGVHFNKGCFPGQEALARVENLGHPAKCLIQLRSTSLGSPTDRVLRDAETGEEVGHLTSLAFSERAGITLALAMVRWVAREAGRRLDCGGVPFDSLGPVPATEAFGR